MYVLLSKVKTDTKLKDKANQCHWQSTLRGGGGDWVGCRKASQAEVAKTGMKTMFCSQNQVGEHR